MLFRLLLVSFLLFSCSSSRMIETSLYFGQSRPDGSMITEVEWQKFKEDYIRKIYQEGSTVIPVSGNWFDTASRQLITEPTFVVVYYHKKSPQLSRQIDSLRHWYKQLFQQQSVLRVDKKVKASF